MARVIFCQRATSFNPKEDEDIIDRWIAVEVEDQMYCPSLDCTPLTFPIQKAEYAFNNDGKVIPVGISDYPDNHLEVKKMFLKLKDNIVHYFSDFIALSEIEAVLFTTLEVIANLEGSIILERDYDFKLHSRINDKNSEGYTYAVLENDNGTKVLMLAYGILEPEEK